MPSKYDGVFHKLQPLPVDPTYQERVNKVKTDLISNPDFNRSAANLVREYALLRDEKDKLEAEASRVSLQIEAYIQMITDSQNAGEEGWGTYGASSNTLRLVSGDKVEVRKEPYTSVIDKAANRQWALENGLDELLTINWMTLNSLAKEKLLKGEASIPGTEVFWKPKIVFTKMKVG